MLDLLPIRGYLCPIRVEAGRGHLTDYRKKVNLNRQSADCTTDSLSDFRAPGSKYGVCPHFDPYVNGVHKKAGTVFWCPRYPEAITNAPNGTSLSLAAAPAYLEQFRGVHMFLPRLIPRGRRTEMQFVLEVRLCHRPSILMPSTYSGMQPSMILSEAYQSLNFSKLN